MMSKGERITGIPMIVRCEGEVSELQRVPLTEKVLSENWLQELIRRNPTILPISDIEFIFDPPISIGREVEVSSGFIDNLIISPEGYLTIVETKLWRNPEARREVVGQIIDYAKDISRWTFEDLDKIVKDYNIQYEGNSNGIIETLHQYRDKSMDVAKIVDTISKNIRRGRFLLLIVGDGIRESVEEMVNFINEAPSMLFTLALVEIQIYRFPGNNNYLIVPQIVTRTNEVTRAVVKIEGVSIEKVEVDIDTGEDQPSRTRRRKIDEEEFYEKMMESGYNSNFVKQLLSDMEELGCIIQWRQSSVMVRLKDPGGSRQRLTIFGVTTDGKIFVGWLPDQLEKIGVDRSMGDNYFYVTSELFSLSEWSMYTELPSVAQLEENYDEFHQIVEELIKGIRDSVDST